MKGHYRGKLLSNFISLSIIQGTNFLLPIIVMPFVIKKIGTEGFGVISVAQVLMIYLSAISDYGFNLTATRDIALFKSDTPRISKIFFVVLASKILITIFCFILLLVLVFFVPFLHQHLLIYLLGFVYVIGQTLLVSWFFQGMEKMQLITISTLIARFIFVILVFAFIRQKEDNIFFLFFIGIGNVIAGLLSIYFAIRIFKLQFTRPAWADVVNELKEGWHITLSNLSINTYLYANIFILRIFTNDLIVGYYSIAEKIFFAIRQILGVFSQAIYPHVCQLALLSKGQIHEFFKKAYLPFLSFVAILSIIVFIFSPQIVAIFLSNAPRLPVVLLRVLSFVPFIVCLNIPAYQLLLAFNKKYSYSAILGLGTLINICVNLLLCNIWGATGTVISVMITELFITIGLNQQLAKNKLLYLLRAKSV
jgi:PST family polysaccharide transporter